MYTDANTDADAGQRHTMDSSWLYKALLVDKPNDPKIMFVINNDRIVHMWKDMSIQGKNSVFLPLNA